MNVAEGELAHGDGHQRCKRRVERERGIAGDETTEARPEHEGHARPGDRGCDAAKRFPPDVRLARHEERGKEMSIEPLLIRDDGPRDQCGTKQRERELDRDAEREACYHGAILMTELACIVRRWLLPA